MITIIIPTLNEEKTIGKVVHDFKKELPHAKIIVYDGNSTDKTKQMAKKNGANVYIQKSKGKGTAIQEIFEYFDSDIFVLVDGDDTYSSKDVHILIDSVAKKNADMCVGQRTQNPEKGAISLLHKIGNKIISRMISICFKSKITDALSGYRVINRKVVKNIILISKGFEIETELTIKALIDGYKIKEIPVSYKKRPKDSHSKINSFNDGLTIIYTIISLFRDYRPLFFFTLISLVFIAIGILLGVSVVLEWLSTGLIERIPTTVFSTLLIITGILFFLQGLLLDSLNSKHMCMMKYLRRKN